MCMRCRIRDAIFQGGSGVNPVEAFAALMGMKEELLEAIPEELREPMLKAAEEHVRESERMAKLGVH